MVPEDANVRFLGFYAETCHSETDPEAVMRTSVALDESARGVTSVMPVR